MWWQQRAGRWCWSATSSTKCWRRPTTSRPCARAKVVDQRLAAESDARTLARGNGWDAKCRFAQSAPPSGVASDVERCTEADGEAVDAERPSHTSAHRIRRCADSKCSRHGPGGVRLLMISRSTSTRARSSASRASRATDSGAGRRALQLAAAVVGLGRVERHRADRAFGGHGRAGIAVIPEDRHDSGVVLDMTVAENLVLVDQSRVANTWVIDRSPLLRSPRNDRAVRYPMRRARCADVVAVGRKSTAGGAGPGAVAAAEGLGGRPADTRA